MERKVDKKGEGSVVSERGVCVCVKILFVGTDVRSSGRVELTHDKLTVDVG
jgi:hypothetical protein